MTRIRLAHDLQQKREALQQAGLDEIERELAQGINRLMLQAPTGFGKTHMTGYLIKKYNHVLFTVPRIILIDQTVDMLQSLGIQRRDIGTMQAHHERTKPHAPIQVASIQTLRKREGRADEFGFSLEHPEFDLVLIDEAHLWDRLPEDWLPHPAWNNIPIIGLSATPWTHGLGKFYKRLVPVTTTEQLIDAGLLCDYDHYASKDPDLSLVYTMRTKYGIDFVEEEVEQVMSQPVILADVVEEWRKRGKGLATVCFAVNRNHARKLRDAFARAGVRTAYMDFTTPLRQRLRIVKKFHERRLDIIINVNVLTVGIDWNIECLILAMATNSEMRYVQIIGRGLRLGDGKKRLLILDHGANAQRLKLVEKIQYTGLHGGEPPLMRAHSTTVPFKCPNCGLWRHAMSYGPCPGKMRYVISNLCAKLS
jgi:superfamily II DNA or RNA helicase